jgi:hypothetical protein
MNSENIYLKCLQDIYPDKNDTFNHHSVFLYVYLPTKRYYLSNNPPYCINKNNIREIGLYSLDQPISVLNTIEVNINNYSVLWNNVKKNFIYQEFINLIFI